MISTILPTPATVTTRFERAATFIADGGVFGAKVFEDRQTDGTYGMGAALCRDDNRRYKYDAITSATICRYIAFWSAERNAGYIITTYHSEHDLLNDIHEAESSGLNRIFVAAFDLDGTDGSTINEISVDIEHIIAVRVIDRFPATSTTAANMEDVTL